MAHEIGHSLGLLHEHTSPDRDQFIQYSCINVRHYQEKLELAQKDGRTKEQLCTDYDTADRYRFYGSEFIRVNYEYVSTSYDYWSIMRKWIRTKSMCDIH
jgi:hypothetical protein